MPRVNSFIPTVKITNDLLNDLKNGRTHLVPGQWCFSFRDKKKVKYVGTFYRNYQGVVAPVVKFSERYPGQSITDWNKTFKVAREKSLEEERRYKQQLKRLGKVNDRQEFTRPTQQEAIQQESKEPELNVEQTPTEKSSSIFRKLLKFFSWSADVNQ